VAWPLLSETARLLWLRAVCAVAEGADVPLLHAVRHASSSHYAADMCVAAVLGDGEHRVAVLGGREGMPRSLGSVYAGSVTLFLGGGLRGVVSRVIGTPGVWSEINGVAVSVDGCTLLLSHGDGTTSGVGSHAIHVFDLADGSRRRIIGGRGDGPLQFSDPHQVCIAPDDCVFVADAGNSRVQVLTPHLDFHAFIGAGQLARPVGVCANADVVVVSELRTHRISVFSRDDGALLRRFGCEGAGDGELDHPLGLCFMSDDRHIAVAEYNNDRVSVFSVEGEFIRHVGVGVLGSPYGVAASAFDELVVADMSNGCVAVFSTTGDPVTTMAVDAVTGVVIHRGSVFAQSYGGEKCVVLT
jgi:DNA-binding beta-propeller fold protein YncE